MSTEHYPTKLAAILYADVAGYSRLIGQDEVGTHQRLGSYLDATASQACGSETPVDALRADVSSW